MKKTVAGLSFLTLFESTPESGKRFARGLPMLGERHGERDANVEG